jgi:hypothetical protein
MAENVVSLAWRRLCNKLPARYSIHITRREDTTMGFAIPDVTPEREVYAAIIEDLGRVVECLQSKMTDSPAKQ